MRSIYHSEDQLYTVLAQAAAKSRLPWHQRLLLWLMAPMIQDGPKSTMQKDI